MAALIRLLFMIMLVFVIVVMFVFIIVVVIVLERAIFCLQGFVNNDADFRCTCVGVIVMLDLERQRCFAFLDAFQVEAPAATCFDVEDGFVANAPAECVFVVLGGGNFFLFVVEELDCNVFAEAVCIDAERFEALVFFALINAVGEFPVGPIEVPAFCFEMFVLVGGGGVAVAASGEERAERGKREVFDFHFYPLYG